MTTEQREPLYASTAKPWLKYYDQKYIDMPLPKCSAFELSLPSEQKPPERDRSGVFMAANSPLRPLCEMSRKPLPPSVLSA